MRALALLLIAALPLGAQAPGPRPGAGRMARLLGLSPDQQAEMKAIRGKHAAALKADHEAARAQAKAFRATMEDPKADPAHLRQAFDQMNGARFQAMLEGRAMRLEMRALLTPEQQAKADVLKADFKERMKARFAARHAGWQQRGQGPEESR